MRSAVYNFTGIIEVEIGTNGSPRSLLNQLIGNDYPIDEYTQDLIRLSGSADAMEARRILNCSKRSIGELTGKDGPTMLEVYQALNRLPGFKRLPLETALQLPKQYRQPLGGALLVVTDPLLDKHCQSQFLLFDNDGTCDGGKSFITSVVVSDLTRPMNGDTCLLFYLEGTN